ncbi:gas vesicle accessory protein GvpU [Kalamiella sp. sgz302252]|uniref:gas vesicle accessory protein GvpU n=1 Tax=Pantoea sp. sgz302252 TaxID=3341827 RepID=UPI0036D352EA
MSEPSEMTNVFASKMRDADLNFIANIASKLGVGLGVTLFVKGALVTGNTISGKEYYEQIVEFFGETQEGSVEQAIANYFKRTGEAYYTPEDDEASVPLNFLHLKDVSFRLGSEQFSQHKNGLLRIKIEEIDGFMLGISTNDE